MESQHSDGDGARFLVHWCVLVESSPLPMAITVAATHQLRCMSPAFATLLDDVPTVPLDHAFADVIPRSPENVVASLLDRVFARDIAEVMPDVEHVHPEHGQLYWTYAVWPLHLDDGQRAGLAIQVTDATASARARGGGEHIDDELREVNERLLMAGLREQEARTVAAAALAVRDRFLSVASHELKTPLTSLVGYTNMLQRGPFGVGADAQVRRMLMLIERQAIRLNNLIDQLLDVSRLEHRSGKTEPGSFDIAELVAQTVDDIALAHPDHRIEVIPTNMPVMVRGDASGVEQVVQNLVGNAVKYSSAGSTIDVRVFEQDGEAVIEVADHGIGITPEAQAELFTPFYRADNGRAYAKGSGIGLYVVKQIVADHGGRTTVDSTAGKGSTFRVTLPIDAASPPDGQDHA